jgi:hypothetical protein
MRAPPIQRVAPGMQARDLCQDAQLSKHLLSVFSGGFAAPPTGLLGPGAPDGVCQVAPFEFMLALTALMSAAMLVSRVSFIWGGAAGALTFWRGAAAWWCCLLPWGACHPGAAGVHCQCNPGVSTAPHELVPLIALIRLAPRSHDAPTIRPWVMRCPPAACPPMPSCTRARPPSAAIGPVQAPFAYLGERTLKLQFLRRRAAASPRGGPGGAPSNAPQLGQQQPWRGGGAPAPSSGAFVPGPAAAGRPAPQLLAPWFAGGACAVACCLALSEFYAMSVGAVRHP